MGWLFIWDIFLGPGDSGTSVSVTDPWVALTAIALRTRRIRLGAFMTPLARRRPWDVARRVAALDRLSGGRMIFGAGLGYRASEFAAIGEDPTVATRATSGRHWLWSGRSCCPDGVVDRVGYGLLAVLTVGSHGRLVVEDERVPGEPAARPERRGDPLKGQTALLSCRQMRQRPVRAVDQPGRPVKGQVPHVALWFSTSMTR